MGLTYTSSTKTPKTQHYQEKPLNFEDFPEAFDEENALMSWNLDVIDSDKIDSSITGDGIYIAVLDTGLVAHWRDYFPEERIKTEWGRAFVDEGVMQAVQTEEQFESNVVESTNYIGDHPHGTHVTSTIIGYCINGIYIQGVAPKATIIPVKVLETYQGLGATFGTSEAVAAGINYITELAKSHPDDKFIISMSLGAALTPIADVEKQAIDNAIDAGVIVIASAGNEGPAGMGSPASYAPVISVGASGWAAYTEKYGFNGEWLFTLPNGSVIITGSWWIQDVPEDNSYISYITEFSWRENESFGFDQELDIIAPGSWVVGPYPLGVGQSHLPWWSNGEGNGVAGQYYFVGGTSMSAPHVSGVAALLLQIDPSLDQYDVDEILKESADDIPFTGEKWVFDIFMENLTLITWGYDGLNAVGAGLLQADTAINLTKSSIPAIT